MIVKNPQPSHPLGSSQVSGSLLCQFVLTESFRVHQQLQFLNPISSKIIDENRISDVVHAHFLGLNSGLVGLVGRTQGYVPTVGWGHESGVLNKLNHYFFLFSQNKMAHQDPSLVPMQYELRETLLMTLQCRDFLHCSREPGMQLSNTQYVGLMRNVNQIHTNLVRFIQNIATSISYFQRDENMLFFLLRYQNSMHACYGKEFLHSLLLSWFPKGLQELESFLHDKYRARSYDHILPIISEKLALLHATP